MSKCLQCRKKAGNQGLCLGHYIVVRRGIKSGKVSEYDLIKAGKLLPFKALEKDLPKQYYVMSEEGKAKGSLAKKGIVAWNKGKALEHHKRVMPKKMAGVVYSMKKDFARLPVVFSGYNTGKR